MRNWKNLQNLSVEEQEVIRQCLRAAVEGPFFPEWEFHALFGLHREEVRSILEEWPRNSAPDKAVRLAVNNSINNLLRYPHGETGSWHDWIDISPDQLRELFESPLGHRLEE